MIYLASPYTHPDFTIMTQRFEAVEAFTAHAILRRHIIFSPIVHGHALAQKFDMPTDFNFWESYALGMLRASNEIWVLKLEGWQHSKGVNGEILEAQKLNKGITYVTENYFPCK